jgi:hypothetical protein
MAGPTDLVEIPLDPPTDLDADDDWEHVDNYEAPPTPSTVSDDALPHSSAGELSDDESEAEAYAHAHGELIPRRKPGGYDSRVEQMLYENPEQPILITDAGKSTESGGRYIVYTIRTGVRASFESRPEAVADHLLWLGACRSKTVLRIRLPS